MPSKLAEMQDAIESNCLAAVQSLKELILGMKVADDSMRDLALFAREGIGRRLAALGMTIEQKYFVPAADYAFHGGCVPISVKGVGMVGSVAVSGLSQEEDHAMVTGAIRRMLGIE
jgi:hypothetical protein